MGCWNTWREKSTNHRIFSAIITVGGFTFAVKLATVVKELLVARQFGTGDDLDAFLIAFLLPSYAINVVVGSLNSALIPTYIQVREYEGRDAAQQLLSNIMFWSIALLTVISAIMVLTSSITLPILGSGFGVEKLTLTRSLFFILMPVLIISGLSSTWTAVLNAGERFALAAFAPVMPPIVMVAVLLLAGKFWGIHALASGMVGGFILQGVLLAWGLKKQRISLVPRRHVFDRAAKQVLSRYAPLVAGTFLMGGTDLVNQSMAAALGPGSVAALNYGNKVINLILSIGTMALGSAVLPYFSKMIAAGDWEELIHTLKTYSRLILVVVIPLTFLVIVFSKPIVQVIFERGAFTGSDTLLVSRIQAMYALQIPFYILGVMAVRLIFAAGKNSFLIIIYFICLVANIFLNLLFTKLMGVAGIALSTSCVYLLSLIQYFIVIRYFIIKNKLSRREA